MYRTYAQKQKEEPSLNSEFSFYLVCSALTKTLTVQLSPLNFMYMAITKSLCLKPKIMQCQSPTTEVNVQKLCNQHYDDRQEQTQVNKIKRYDGKRNRQKQRS